MRSLDQQAPPSLALSPVLTYLGLIPRGRTTAPDGRVVVRNGGPASAGPPLLSLPRVRPNMTDHPARRPTIATTIEEVPCPPPLSPPQGHRSAALSSPTARRSWPASSQSPLAQSSSPFAATPAMRAGWPPTPRSQSGAAPWQTSTSDGGYPTASSASTSTPMTTSPARRPWPS